MNVICYLCNEQVNEWRQNLAELQSKHSKMLISDFFKRLLNDFVSQRDIEDEANRICLKCLEIIDDYDLMCVSAVQKESQLRELLLQTERLFDGHKIKTEVENEAEVCHSETVFVSDGSATNQRSATEQEGVEMEHQMTSSQAETLNHEQTTVNSTPPKTKKILIQKKGKKITVRLMKQPPNVKLVNSEPLKLTSMNSELLKPNEMKSLVAKLQAIKTISEKHLDESETAEDAESKPSRQRAPKTPRTQCQKCNDGVLYKKWHYQVRNGF